MAYSSSIKMVNSQPPTPMGNSQQATRQNYYIGRSNWDENEYFNGLVDDLRIYNRPLADTEIQTVARKKRHPSTPQVLHTHHHLHRRRRRREPRHRHPHRCRQADPPPRNHNLLGPEIHEHEAGTDYTDPGSKSPTAQTTPSLTKPTITPDTFDNQTIGTATLTYNYTDAAGKASLSPSSEPFKS